MSDDKPRFRFNPNAYRHESTFEASDESCDVCARPCVWKYGGAIYAARDKPTVCARCIAEGRLADYFGARSYTLHDVELGGEADTALEDELLRRTPGVSCFNPFEWPVLDRKPLAFLGYGEDQELVRQPEAEAAVREAFEAMGWDYDGPSPYALIFREVDGPRYRAVIDLD